MHLLKNFVSYKVLIAVAAIVATVCFYLIYRAPQDLTSAYAPNFSLKNRYGQEITLNTLRGKYVLIHFWATWCGICQLEMPTFNNIATEYKNSPDLVILGLSLDDTGRDGGGWPMVEKYERRMPLAFAVLMDSRGLVADKYGAYTLPQTYLVSQNGIILMKWVGETTVSMRQELDAFLKGGGAGK